MDPMTPEQAHQYLDRWKLVKESELAQLRSTSMETKLQQLAVLMASRGLFQHGGREREKQADQLRVRWARIRKALSG